MSLFAGISWLELVKPEHHKLYFQCRCTKCNVAWTTEFDTDEYDDDNELRCCCTNEDWSPNIKLPLTPFVP